MEPSTPERQVLDPFERVSEILFGLIMALSFTGTISVATTDRSEIRPVLVGALGCNIAWGLVDAVMYLVGTLYSRSRALKAVADLRRATDTEGIRRAVAEVTPPRLAAALTPADLQGLKERIVGLGLPSKTPWCTATDLKGAAAVFALVVVATFPVVVPFLFVHDVELAKRLSNGVAILMLFLSGALLAKLAGGRPLLLGLAMAAVGTALVGATIALGG
jgi:VIT1/CCC1 family predicted Fe2+/Mn2+ transporter